jgi:hypothetical protein
MAILRLRWGGAFAARGAMAGLERNRYRTHDSILAAVHGVLDTHPELTTWEQVAHVLGFSYKTLTRRFDEFGIDKDKIGVDWKARAASARVAASLAVQPCRWTFGLVITASTLEEAVARFRAEVSPSVEIESVQKH